MRVLAICNTYYQILVCLKMRLSVLRNDFMDIVISDQCGVVKGIADRLCASEVFDRVYFKSTKAMAMGKDTIFGKVHDVRQVIFGNPEFADVCGTYYDKLLFNNTDIVVHMFYASLEKLNPNIRCARFEEGILSYNNFFQSFSKLEMSRVCRKLLHKSNLLERIDEFYCFTPEAYCGDLRVVKIPPIVDNHEKAVTEYLSLFDLPKQVDTYTQKYIYFSSVYDIEGGGPIGEINLIKKIAKKVGPENLLVKAHPRDNPQRFIEAGIHVDKNSSIPWEAVQFRGDFSRHVFLTANSGSVLSVNMIMKNKPATYFLYPLCDISHNLSAQNAVRIIENVLDLLHKTDSGYEKIIAINSLDRLGVRERK